NQSFNVSVSEGGNISRAIAGPRGNVAGDGGGKSGMDASQGGDMVQLGFGADVGNGTADTQFDLIDINGDGLPDKVFGAESVLLNVGYRCAPTAEAWGGGMINNGQTVNTGVNLGFNLNFYSLAGGLNLGTGDTRSDETYADINGDGLLDKIVAGSPLTVRLNTGTGFTAPIAC